MFEKQIKNLDSHWPDFNQFVPGRPPCITQGELAEFQKLQQLERELRERVTQLRATIIKKLEGGARVEPGSLTAFLDVQKNRQFSYGKLIPLLGQQVVDELKRQIEPTISKRVFVRELAGST